MSRLAIYESAIFRVIFGGLTIDDGRSDPFFTIAPAGDAYVVEGPGADGHVAFCGTNNDLYTITLNLKGTSSAHAALSAVHILDRKSFNGSGIAALFCQDEGGSTLIQTAHCRIMAMPEQAFGVTKPDVAWSMMAVIPPGGFLLGGN